MFKNSKENRNGNQKNQNKGESILTKECRKVDKMTPKIRELIDDMFDTMYEAYGVGLAAPQVGILKQIVVIDTTGEDTPCAD